MISDQIKRNIRIIDGVVTATVLKIDDSNGRHQTASDRKCCKRRTQIDGVTMNSRTSERRQRSAHSTLAHNIAHSSAARHLAGFSNGTLFFLIALFAPSRVLSRSLRALHITLAAHLDGLFFTHRVLVTRIARRLLRTPSCSIAPTSFAPRISRLLRGASSARQRQRVSCDVIGDGHPAHLRVLRSLAL